MRLVLALGLAIAAALLTPAAAQQSTLQWRLAPQTVGAPVARQEHSAAVLNGKLYLMGGREFDGRKRPLEILDLKTGQWTQGASPPVPFHHAQAVVHEGRIYIVGALINNLPREDVVPNILIYDPASNAWSTGPEIPADRRRGAAGLVVVNGVFYLIAGNTRGHQSGYVPWVDSFDPRTGIWRKLADAPRPRDHAHAAVLGGKIYIAGGRRSSLDTNEVRSLTVPELDIYDIASGRWTTASAPIPTQRAGVGVVSIGGMIVVIGGETEKQLPAHSEVEAFDPASGAWRSLPPLKPGRHGIQAVVVDNTVQVVAGNAGRPNLGDLNDRWILSGFR